jgi:hypothetical protein
VATAAASEPRARRLGRLREPAVRGAHLLVLSAFALAQPLFDILAKHPEFFAVRGSKPADIVLFALAVTFVPAAVLLAVELAAGAVHRRAARMLHFVFVGGLSAAFAIQLLERAGLAGTAPLIAAAVVAGAAAAVALWRTSLARSFLTILSPAPAVFLAIFLFFSPVTDLVFPGDVEVATAEVRSEAPVVLLVLDELPVVSLLDREGRIDAGRYPNFARLVRDSTWFRNTTTLSAQTTRAVPAILTGKAPRGRKLPVFQDHPENLFTLLGRRYRLNVHESQTRLCPDELCSAGAPAAGERLSSLYADARVVYAHLVAPPALAEERLPAIDEAWTGFGEEGAAIENLDAETEAPDVDVATFYVDRLDDFNGFLRTIEAPRDGDPPSLNLLHLLMPHGPWLHFPSGRVSAVDQPRAPGRDGEHWWSESLALQAYQRHLLQLGYTDRLLGRLVRRLEETGLYDRSLVAVVADHGIAFRGDDERRLPTRKNLQDLAFVPFFVKRPGQRDPEVVDRHTRIVDVVPTIADALGVEVPWELDGRSGFSDGPGPDEVQVGRLTSPYARLLERRADALRRQVDLFGDSGWDLFELGPYGDLVGRSLDRLEVAGAVEAAAALDAISSRHLRSLARRSQLVPSPLGGSVTGAVEPGQTLAVALNGRIAAVCETYQRGESPVRFSALAPEDAFRPGANETRVFLVEGSPDAPLLRELETTLG